MTSDDEILDGLRSLITKENLALLTRKTVTKQLEEKLGISLASKKEFIKEKIVQVIQEVEETGNNLCGI